MGEPSELLGLPEGDLLFQEEMSGETVVSTAVPAATTRTTSFKSGSPSSKYVKLNIGGALYYTTMQTLTKQDTMLKAMFSGRMEVLTDSEGKALGEERGPRRASSARGALGLKWLLATLQNGLPRLQNCFETAVAPQRSCFCGPCFPRRQKHAS